MTYFFSMNSGYLKQRLFALSLALGILITSAVHASDEPLNLNLRLPENTPTANVVPIIEEKSVVVTSEPQKNLDPPMTDCISRDAEGRFLGWIDSQHCLLSNRTATTAQWFDGLFGHTNDINEAKLKLRLINDVNWYEAEGLSSKIRFRASAVLPNAKRRLRLVVSDDEDALHPERNQLAAGNIEPKTSAAIRWIPDYISRVKYTFDLGLHSTPDIYGRVRAQRSWRVSDSTIINATETFRYGVKEEAKSLTQLALERLLNDKTVFRFGNALQYWQNEPKPVGMRWSQDLSVLHRLGQQKTISYGVVFEGVQRPQWQLQSDGLFVLYRQSFWRSWLYYEIEPHLSRYREQRWDVKSSLIFRIEANLGG
ncbi:hypothetical protein FK216_09590 [Moraxellaceae bacterium AER2_44_116]|nr:hypothetical protein [Moraxellaceae bacterium]TQC97517.1 hypothetical protein FK216_09590 [Moraxellaceae bacterium AER2_44_116]